MYGVDAALLTSQRNELEALINSTSSRLPGQVVTFWKRRHHTPFYLEPIKRIRAVNALP